jgi:hypothetical protein
MINYCNVCNLRGLRERRDLVVKDEYSNLWAYTDELKPLWHRQLNTGHFLAARDINGDGRDEVMGGYSMLRPDETTLWTVPGGDPLRNRYPGPEHVDGLLIDRFGPGSDAPIRVALAASDLGFILLDVEGHILAQHRIGHAQWIAAGRFRPDLPGRQLVVGTQWGNNGIINLFDCEGRLLLIRELPSARTWPVYWLGKERPLTLFEGWATGMWNSRMERVFRLPGALSIPPHALDLNGDGLDELLVLDGNRVQVYAPDGIKGSGSVPAVSLTNWHAGSHGR